MRVRHPEAVPPAPWPEGALGGPQVVTDQPFKWLLMHVDRPEGQGDDSEDRA